MAQRTLSGEPYELAGSRMVFTNWYYVRPGGFAWRSASGEWLGTQASAGAFDGRYSSEDCPRGIRLAVQPAQCGGPIIEPEQPWETGPSISINTVLRDGATYRAWASNLYFESKDGVNWERPKLGLTDWNGSRENNLLPLAIANATVFRDPSAKPEERYKFVREHFYSAEDFEAFKKRRPGAWEPRTDRQDANLIFGVQGAVSPDGLRWSILPEPLVMEHSDTQVTACYDERLGKYVMYTRNWMVGPRSARVEGYSTASWLEVARRSIGRSESADFRNFPLSDVILVPPPEMLPSDLLYTNCYTTIPRAPDHRVMFPTIWHAAVSDSTTVRMASSYNGDHWHFLPNSEVLDSAPFGEWDGGCVFAVPNLIELANGDFALPYNGYNVPHKYPRKGHYQVRPGYAVWPKGRLVALEAPEVGEFATVAIMPPGRKLRINALTARAGEVRIEAANMADRKPLAGRSFADADAVRGDCHWTPVTWRGNDDLGHADGAPVVLRFRMRNARIYGLEFE